MSIWKNSVVTAVIGLLVGFFAGYMVNSKPVAAPAVPAAGANPHAGIPGAPALGAMPGQPPAGGRTAATANPQLMEQQRQLETLLAKDPNNYDHLLQMGNTLYDMNNFARAAEFYEKARLIKDTSSDVLTDLGVCYRETGKPAEALKLFDRAADLSSKHWQSRYNAAVVRLFDLNDARGAAEEIAKLKAAAGNASGAPDLAGLEQEIAKRLK